ncbi:lithostathine-like [Leuresthes tenuis]|uniref:lithostathine-like n=1 Tax=Leuresthes tenuis TaxID=355514 RepID=UPI003B5026E6
MCQNLNSDLVQITNQTVQTEVKSLLKEQQGLQKGIWIGLERSIFGTNVKWKWISGSTDIYPLWNSSFPVNRLDNHCGKVVWDEITQEISLLDANCHERLPFICQGRK